MGKYSLYFRMGAYVFVTTVITFVTLLDTIEGRNFSDISNLEWVKLFLKSLLPGFVSLKAFLDTTINSDKKAESEVLQG
jgi:hypothetical protein